jgi:hypothetical protein
MNPRDAARLDLLIRGWLDGTLPPDDFVELNRRLQSEPAARRALLRAARLDTALRERATSGAESAWLDAARLPRRARAWPWRLAWAAAALVCFAAYFAGTRMPALRPGGDEQIDRGAAILTRAVDAEWTSPKAVAARPGDSLHPGPLGLRTGVAQIEFFSGASLVVEGPAEFEIISPWRVVWRGGRGRVRVPPAARGFEVLAPGLQLVDLGTEFGVEVDRVGGAASVQVFSGEVVARPDQGAELNLKEGQGLERRGGTVTRTAVVRPQDFTGTDRLRDLGRAQDRSRFAQWREFSATQRGDSRLLAYYAMEHDESADRLVRNAARPGNPLRDGGAVGTLWAQGRWPQKDALEFKRPGDRVRLQIDGRYDAITFAAWVRIDGLDRKYNALILTDGYEAGEPHWQIYEDGRLMFSVAYPDPGAAGKSRNQKYFSPVIFDRANAGRWHHVAVTYDNRSGAAVQYVDGTEVSREVHEFHAPGRPLTLGASELGNWGLPTRNHEFPIRNLNGRIDEFAVYGAALSGPEIRAMFEAGRPE